jgi:hypothetical protein
MNHRPHSQNRLYPPLATLGHRRNVPGQLYDLWKFFAYGCATASLLEYDEKFCQLCFMIYGSLCHHQKDILFW